MTEVSVYNTYRLKNLKAQVDGLFHRNAIHFILSKHT